MTFGMLYAYSERYVLPLSHDEVVHGKGSLIGKMPGDNWQQFANLRAYFGWMWTFPGKKLLFMGGEIAQWNEWNSNGSIEWSLLDYPLHRGVQSLIVDLNALYRKFQALYGADNDPNGFQWVVADDSANSVYAYFRRGRDGSLLLVVSNMTPVPRHGYRFSVPKSRPLAGAHQHRRLLLRGKQSRQWRPGRGATFARGRGARPHSPALGHDHPGSRRASLLTAHRAHPVTPPRISAPAWRRGTIRAVLRVRALHPRDDRHALIPCFHVQFGTRSLIAGGLADRIRASLRFSDLRDYTCISGGACVAGPSSTRSTSM